MENFTEQQKAEQETSPGDGRTDSISTLWLAFRSQGKYTQKPHTNFFKLNQTMSEETVKNFINCLMILLMLCNFEGDLDNLVRK